MSEPTRLPDGSRLTASEQSAGLDIAVRAIGHQLRTGRRWLPDIEGLPPGLRPMLSSFVTLTINGDLRGCIGSLSASEPLGIDIARHAVDAAFNDPRFPALTAGEYPLLDLEVSVLSPMVALPVSGWDDLIAAVRPGIDGLLVEAGWHRATLLPAVWSSLPEPSRFLTALWHKAGLSPKQWPRGIEIMRYSAAEFGGPAADHGANSATR